MFNIFLFLDVVERMNQTIAVIQDNIQQRCPRGIDVDSTKTIIDGRLNKKNAYLPNNYRPELSRT